MTEKRLSLGHIKQALLILQTSYPFMKEPSEEQAKIWLSFFANVSPDDFLMAIREHVAGNKHIPTISEINDILNGSNSTWELGWRKVREAIRRFGSYNTAEAKRFLGKYWQVAEVIGWNTLCTCNSDEMVAHRANFRLAYENIKKRQDKQNNVSRQSANILLIQHAKLKTIENN